MASVKLLTVSLVVALMSLGSAQNILTEERDVTGFSRVALNVPGDLELVQGGGESLRLEMSPKYDSKITTRVEDGTLTIDTDAAVLTRVNRDVLRFFVGADVLDALTADGSGDITARVDTESLALELNDTDGVTLTGRADTLTLNAEDTDGLELGGLGVRSATVTVVDADDISLCVTESLELSVEDADRVVYYGDPARSSVDAEDAEVEKGGACP